MSRSELDGYVEALARLHGKKPAAGNTRSTRHVKSKRQKRRPNGA